MHQLQLWFHIVIILVSRILHVFFTCIFIAFLFWVFIYFNSSIWCLYRISFQYHFTENICCCIIVLNLLLKIFDLLRHLIKTAYLLLNLCLFQTSFFGLIKYLLISASPLYPNLQKVGTWAIIFYTSYSFRIIIIRKLKILLILTWYKCWIVEDSCNFWIYRNH